MLGVLVRPGQPPFQDADLLIGGVVLGAASRLFPDVRKGLASHTICSMLMLPVADECWYCMMIAERRSKIACQRWFEDCRYLPPQVNPLLHDRSVQRLHVPEQLMINAGSTL